MRVLRVRRGFTTNSSGANEYLPTPAPAPSNTKQHATQKAQVSSQTSAARVAHDGAAAQGARDAAKQQARAPVKAKTRDQQEPRRDAGPQATVATAPDAGSPARTAPAPHGNALTLVLLVVGVMMLLASERVIHYVRRKLAGRKHEGPTDGRAK